MYMYSFLCTYVAIVKSFDNLGINYDHEEFEGRARYDYFDPVDINSNGNVLYHTRISYHTRMVHTIRVYGTILYTIRVSYDHTRMVRTIRVWYVPYA